MWFFLKKIFRKTFISALTTEPGMLFFVRKITKSGYTGKYSQEKKIFRNIFDTFQVLFPKITINIPLKYFNDISKPYFQNGNGE
jgi:hypothetical protein